MVICNDPSCSSLPDNSEINVHGPEPTGAFQKSLVLISDGFISLKDVAEEHSNICYEE